MSHQDIKRLINTHKRRLQKLEEQRALQGGSADPKLLIEIEDIEAEIRKLQSELAEQGGKARSSSRGKEEIDFIKAYLTFVRPDILLTDSYSQMVSRHYNRICAEIERLEEEENWEAILGVKQRLREYFEYSGKYLDGVEFGRRYVRALEKLGQFQEAMWTKVKHVGYLLILAGRYIEGRKEIFEAIDVIQKSPFVMKESLIELLFYSYRYLGISYQRDSVSGNLDKAIECLTKAENCLEQFQGKINKNKEMRARIFGNYGNIALEKRDYSTAIKNYTSSRHIFSEVGDTEHIGIANLQIGQTIISSGLNVSEANEYLETAESIFVQIGWIEGQGRVFEHYARLYEQLASSVGDADESQRLLKSALSAARRSRALFEQIGHQKGLGRVEVILEKVQNLLE